MENLRRILRYLNWPLFGLFGVLGIAYVVYSYNWLYSAIIGVWIAGGVKFLSTILLDFLIDKRNKKGAESNNSD